jgi:hypothetical protein
MIERDSAPFRGWHMLCWYRLRTGRIVQMSDGDIRE